MSIGPLSIHAWGFFDDDGKPRLPDSIAASDLSVYLMANQVLRNVRHFDGDATSMRTTRTLDGWLVAVEFETPARATAARMWHQIRRPSTEWPDAPSATTEESA